MLTTSEWQGLDREVWSEAAGAQRRPRTNVKTSDRPIANIARDCGFYDHSSFIRHFKRTMGVTPLVYRKRYAVERP